MNTIRHLFLIVVAIIPLISKSQDYCAFIKNVQNYQDSVKIIPQRTRDIIDSNTFDIHTYMSFFDEIEVENGFGINVYFFDNFLDGSPFLYVLKESEKLVEKNRRKLYSFLINPVAMAKNHIRPKNSEMGFFQYLFFYELGEQFALKWHSNYGQKSG